MAPFCDRLLNGVVETGVGAFGDADIFRFAVCGDVEYDLDFSLRVFVGGQLRESGRLGDDPRRAFPIRAGPAGAGSSGRDGARLSGEVFQKFNGDTGAFGHVLDKGVCSKAQRRDDCEGGKPGFDRHGKGEDVELLRIPINEAEGVIGAGISAVSMLPYLGDAAKLGKFRKWAETVANAAEMIGKYGADNAVGRQLLPALEKITNAVDAIPAGVFNNLPTSAQKSLLGMRKSLDTALSRVGLSATSEPGSLAHKAQRWDDYQARAAANGVLSAGQQATTTIWCARDGPMLR